MGYDAGPTTMMFFMLLMICPWIYKTLNIPIFNAEAEGFLVNVMKQTLEKRRKEGVSERNDLVDLLVQAFKVECPFFEKFIEFIDILFFRIFRKMALDFLKNSRNAIL
jgi:hypothetical protein